MTKNPVTGSIAIDGNAGRDCGAPSNANAASMLLVNVIAIAAILLAGAATIHVALADTPAGAAYGHVEIERGPVPR